MASDTLSDDAPDERRNLIVNYLPNITPQAFRNMFTPFGEIESSRVVYDKLTGVSLGYGFVKFKSEEAAASAVTSMNGQQIENKVLKVAYAQKVNAEPQPANVYVAHLEKTITLEELNEMFAPYGNIVETKLLQDPNTGESKGVAFVRYETREQAETAINTLNNYQPSGSANPLIVKFSDSKADKKRKRGLNYNPFYPVRFDPMAGAGVPRGVAPAAYPVYSGQAGFAAVPPNASLSQTYCLFVYNLPAASDDSYLYRLFAPYGAITSVKAVKEPTTDVCKGFGFVHFLKFEEAHQAILALNGSEIMGKCLQEIGRAHV